MIYLNTTQHRTNSLPRNTARSLNGWLRSCLKLLAPIPVAIAKAMTALSKVIGAAAEMAYVAPFMPNGKIRK